ncbi:hypothetical protein ABIF68_005574 [Bradyrhizobium japonicum]
MTRLPSDAPTCPTGQLPRRFGRTVDDARYVLERQIEHVVQDEGHAFLWRQHVEYGQHGRADGVGHSYIALRIGIGRQCLGFSPNGLLPSSFPSAQLIQADAPDDSREPAGQILEAVGSSPTKAQPSFLDGIFRLRARPEHAVGHRLQMRSVGFKLFG